MSQLFCQTGELCGKCYSLQLQICHCAWHGLLMTTFISKSHVSLCCWRVDFVIVKYNEIPRRWSEWSLPKIQLKWFRSTKTHTHKYTFYILFKTFNHLLRAWTWAEEKCWLEYSTCTNNKLELPLASSIHSTEKKEDFSVNLLKHINVENIQLLHY